MINEEHQNRNEDIEEIDPLEHFLFGPKPKRNKGLEEDVHQEKVDQEDNESSNHKQADWLFGGSSRESKKNDDWLFGGRNRDFTEDDERLFGRSRDSHDDGNFNSKVNNILNNINVEELMNNIDTLMTSANQLKPLLKKASPFLEQLLKK